MSVGHWQRMVRLPAMVGGDCSPALMACWHSPCLCSPLAASLLPSFPLTFSPLLPLPATAALP